MASPTSDCVFFFLFPVIVTLVTEILAHGLLYLKSAEMQREGLTG